MAAAQAKLQVVDKRRGRQAVPALQETWHIFDDPAALAVHNDIVVGRKVQKPERPHVGFVGHENIIGT